MCPSRARAHPLPDRRERERKRAVRQVEDTAARCPVRPVTSRRRRSSADPTGEGAGEQCETGRMPVLDPNPKNGQKKMLLVFGAFLLIFVIIGVIASIASP